MNEVFNDQMIFALGNGVRFLPQERQIINDSGAIVELSENSYRFLLLILTGEMDKQNIIEQVWSEQKGLVSDSSYYGQIYILRKALGLVGLSGTLIKTIPRKGVKYTGSVVQQPIVAEDMLAAAPSITDQQSSSEQTESEAASEIENQTSVVVVSSAVPVLPPGIIEANANQAVEEAREWYQSRRWNQLITVLAVIAVCWLSTLAFAVFYFSTH